MASSGASSSGSRSRFVLENHATKGTAPGEEKQALIPDHDTEELETTSIDDDNDEQGYVRCEQDGATHVVRWSKQKRCCVVGPDWPCLLVTFVVISIPSILAIIYLMTSEVEQIIFYIIFATTVVSLMIVACLDPGIVPNHRRSRSRRWTYWYASLYSFGHSFALVPTTLLLIHSSKECIPDHILDSPAGRFTSP